MTNNNLRLYVILRSDLESMTVGKAAAQVAHAASQVAMLPGSEIYQSWASQAEGFGTTIVLDGGQFKDDYSDEVPSAILTGEEISGAVVDPTYPVRDGKKTHLIELCTCYWILCDPDKSIELREWLDQFKLYNGNHD